jgi:Copper amine oxidase, enzyme domain
MSKAQKEKLSMKIVHFGPSQNIIDRVSAGLTRNASVQKYMEHDKYRLLYFELVDSDAENNNKGRRKPVPPNKFHATLFDYAKNRTIFVDGSLNKPKRVKVTESSIQPLPSNEEFDEAVKVLMDEDDDLGLAIREKQLHPYPPMPPLINTELPDGTVERTIAVGLLPASAAAAAAAAAKSSTANEEEVVVDRHKHEIVGVNMIRRTVIRFENNAPANSAAHNPICGLPNASQSTISRTAGQVWVNVYLGSTLIWRFLAVRPAASSGTNGSGIELRYVDYRGKRVLYRAHVPILNVKYNGDACGPYRDWQNQEGMIQANGTNVAPGFRLCPSPATTILDTGSDTGNFLGTGIYVQGLEVVLVSEMQAGWYRYISEWRLHANGTIRPRFGFSAVQSSCVCTAHHHHAYWRFDFDIKTAGNNRVKEFNDPPLIGSSTWHNKNYEIRRPRNPATRRKWRVENIATGEGYEIIPGPSDGIATSSPDWPFPRGDLWILRYHGAAEIDDGSVATGPPYEAELDRFLNGEPINGSDVVIWYGAHFTHDIASEAPGSHGHEVGPDLKPINW